MNLCFLIGKIVSDIHFKFIINSKNISVSMFEIQLSNKSIIKVKAYNEIADFCYQKLVKGDAILIYGILDTTEVVIKEIYCLSNTFVEICDEKIFKNLEKTE